MGKVVIDITGFITSNTPKRKVRIPKVKVHPQLSISLRFEIEKIISDMPEKRKERLNKDRISRNYHNTNASQQVVNILRSYQSGIEAELQIKHMSV